MYSIASPNEFDDQIHKEHDESVIGILYHAIKQSFRTIVKFILNYRPRSGDTILSLNATEIPLFYCE